MKKISQLIFASCCFFFSGFSQDLRKAPAQNRLIDGHPAWIMQGNIYEVNTRQYTPEGTLNEFAEQLDRLKAMGVQTLWFMPLNPISKTDRKGTLGSYYAVSDYTALNPEYGVMADWIKMVKTIHGKGMKVIIDWVPNHTGADNHWLTEHPDFFVKDSTGKAAMAVDWADTRQLDYNNMEMQDSMIAAMKFWIDLSNIDGFRCDVAWNVPAAFWSRCIPELKKKKAGIFMLAEGDKTYLPPSGFDAIYPWNMFSMMKKVAAGERPAFGLDSAFHEIDSLYPPNTIEMYFTSNHDENSWNKADYGVFPGAEHAPFAVFTQTMARGVPLIYGGQEEPVLRALPFFEKDSIHFEHYARAAFYKTLLGLRKRDPALSPDAGFKKVLAGNDSSVYAFVREKAGRKVLVILNLSNREQAISIKEKSLRGNPLNVFMHRREPVSSRSWKMEPWGYAVYEYGAE
ncbi:MAG TPA: alpha-amylase family glycosyl hydrolase [Puia sp.]|nr:alpha-amylase family glycosyl hydrolase [Puia sp.]